MFGRSKSENILPHLPDGVAQLLIVVADEKGRIRHRTYGGEAPADESTITFLGGEGNTVQHTLVTGAIRNRQPISFSLTQGDGRHVYLYILPYERRRGRLRFVCIQVLTEASVETSREDAVVCSLSNDRLCFLVTDMHQQIRSVGSRVPAQFGYTASHLADKYMAELFSRDDYDRLKNLEPDFGDTARNCKLVCRNGSKRDVELKKFSLPDHMWLYGICDVTAPQRTEELADAVSRERQRIGQDLHDSIGQTLTGISLLSQSLSNLLTREDHHGSMDASQISGLADEASNQIRQISRGLMPTEVMQRGLYGSLEELARSTTLTSGIPCETALDDSLKLPDAAVQTHLYRIAQEAINNSLRHSSAGRIEIRFSGSEDGLRLEVIDDGRWIEPSADVIGIGMKTMEYRASAVGGRLHVGTGMHGGTKVCCILEPEDSLATRS